MENICLSGVLFLLGVLCSYGCWLINEDKYWFRVWLLAGCPSVSTIKELKDFLGIRSNKGVRACLGYPFRFIARHRF